MVLYCNIQLGVSVVKPALIDIKGLNLILTKSSIMEHYNLREGRTVVS